VQLLEFFKENYLTEEDLLFFVSVLTRFESHLGTQSCWCLKTSNHSKLQGFTTSHSSRPLYKGRDARILVMAIVDQYQDASQPMVVRRHQCSSAHCLNPNHYYFGTKQDVCFERGQRKGSLVTPAIVKELRAGFLENKTYAALARQYKIPYHIVRRICIHEAYD
jgi:hypothetical protein